jgi:hypothetical protein
VDILHGTRGDVYAQAVGVATGHLLGSVREELASVKTQLATVSQTVVHTVTMVQELCTEYRTTVEADRTRQQSTESAVLTQLNTISLQQADLQKMLKLMKQQQQQHQEILQQRQSFVETGGILVDYGAGEDDDFDEMPGLLQDPPEATTAAADRGGAAVSFQTAATRRNKEMGLNAFNVMRQTPRLPSLEGQFPETWKELVSEWKNNDLESFINAKKQHWKAPVLVQRFVKRHRAMIVLRKYKEYLGDRRKDEEAVAKMMDSDRVSKEMSLSKHMTLLFKNDNTIIRRIRTTKANKNNNNT